MESVRLDTPQGAPGRVQEWESLSDNSSQKWQKRGEWKEPD